jgi:hypothetical protein
VTPRGRNAGSSEGEGRVVLMADRGPDGPRVGAALREAGFSLVTCDVVALPERVARIDPVAVVLDVEQPHAEVAIARMLEQGGEPPALVAVGPRARAEAAGLRNGPRVALFKRPVPVVDVVAFVQDAVVVAAVRTEVPSSVGSLPFAADSDALLVSDFPALAGLPEVESILPDLDGRPASGRNAGELSPEIEALLDAAARRVRDTPEAEIDPDGRSRVLVPPEMMAAVEDFLMSDEEPAELSRGAISGAVAAPRTPTHRAASEPPSSLLGTLDDDAVDREAITASEMPSGQPSVATEPPRTAAGEATSIRAQKTEVGRISGSSPPPSRRDRTQVGDDREVFLGRFADFGEPVSSRADTHTGPVSQPRRSWVSPSSLPGSLSGDALTDPGSFRAPRTEPPPTAMQPHVPYPPSPSAAPPARSPRLVGPRGSRPPAAQPPAQDARMPLADLSESDPIAALAMAIGERVTGALVLSDPGRQITRRILLRDGDLVNAASEHPDDALIVFLVERGDLTPELARRCPKLPPTGRHAAAALIAHGILGQDDLWPVLRTHAEWLIARALRTRSSVAELEVEPPERLRSEPNVFGGAAGVEIFIDAVRRVIPADEALTRLGGNEAVVVEGPRSGLLAESALGAVETEALRGAAGATLGQLVGTHGRGLLAVVYGLAALGIVGVERPLGGRHDEAPSSVFDPLDAEAVRQRVQARLALVYEGDYFAVLGLTPAATPYEIKRAYLDLRRSFEPSRLLTAATADLADDVALIVEILEEAFDVLRDPRRCARYRRAIEAPQPR